MCKRKSSPIITRTKKIIVRTTGTSGFLFVLCNQKIPTIPDSTMVIERMFRKEESVLYGKNNISDRRIDKIPPHTTAIGATLKSSRFFFLFEFTPFLPGIPLNVRYIETSPGTKAKPKKRVLNGFHLIRIEPTMAGLKPEKGPIEMKPSGGDKYNCPLMVRVKFGVSVQV